MRTPWQQSSMSQDPGPGGGRQARRGVFDVLKLASFVVRMQGGRYGSPNVAG